MLLRDKEMDFPSFRSCDGRNSKQKKVKQFAVPFSASIAVPHVCVDLKAKLTQNTERL